MTTTPQRGQQRLEQDQRETLNSLIGEQVLHILGEPGNLFAVQVRRLWNNRYRVNVLVGGDPTSVRVAHSYFLTADSDGNIVGATPKIARQY